MATAFMGDSHARFHRADYPTDYYTLADELHACTSKEQLRTWAMLSTARRAALPREAQASLRVLTIAQQTAIRASAYGNAAAVINARDADHLGTVVRRLLDVLDASADYLTESEARDFAETIRNTAAYLAPVAFDGRAH